MTRSAGSTRELLLASWRASQRNGQRRSNAASIAGQLLDESRGDAASALSTIPPDDDPSSQRVREYLERVLAEDRAACT